MKKMLVKKLALTRETLRSLSEEQTRLAVGEAESKLPREPPATSDSVRICCA